MEEQQKQKKDKVVTGTIANFLSEKTKETSQDTNNSGQEKNKLDNNENNSYNSDEQTSQSSENGMESQNQQQANDTFERMFNEKFGGKVENVLKSYQEAQKGATKLAQQKKEIESKYNRFNQILDSSPTLQELVMKADNGENVENLIASRKESDTDKPASTSESKLGTSFDDINEEYLISNNYLDKNKKSSLTEDEWRLEVQKATTNALPRVMAERSYQEYEKKRTQEEQRRKQEQIIQYLRDENDKRYDQSLDNAVKMGFDFAGKHSDLLDEIHTEMKGFRDPSNPQLLRKDAFELASQLVARQNGVQLGAQPRSQQSSINYEQPNRTGVPNNYSNDEPPKFKNGLPNPEYMNFVRSKRNKEAMDKRKGVLSKQ